jgi:hypothetical protein
MNHIDARNTGLLSLRERMDDKWGLSCYTENGIPVNPCIRVHLQHNSIGEYYEAFLFWNCLSECYCLSLSFHGIDNQGRRYCNPSCGVKTYSNKGLAMQQVEIMAENRNRLTRWIQRNAK